MYHTTVDAFGNLDVELDFTGVYRRHQGDPVAIREATCLAAIYPRIMLPAQDDDLLAGRIAFPLVSFDLEMGSYYCIADRIGEAMAKGNFDAGYRARVEEMLAFWKVHSTAARHDATLPPQLIADTQNPIATGGPRLAGTVPDYGVLHRRGIGSLLAEIRDRKAGAGDPSFYEGMELALGVLVSSCRHCAQQARQQAASAAPARQAQLREMADSLERITDAAPTTFQDALQLHWLYSLISGVVNYGRMDVALGDFCARDIAQGRLTEAGALALLQSLWRLIAARRCHFNSRVVVGGKGRPNEANADRFAMLAMEATRTVLETEPQLTLRFYAGQNPALMKKALDVIGEGRTFPMLYNDDVNIPAVANCFHVTPDEAAHYIPYGCGEYALEGLSVGSPNCALNLLKALEATLYDGADAMTGKPLGLKGGGLESFQTFDDLLSAYKKQAQYHAEQLVLRHVAEYKLERQTAGYLLTSLLYEHVLQRGKSIVDGGCRYAGAILETFGMVNAADSLAAIKALVYDRGTISRPQLLAALAADFVGYEKEHRLLLDVPKYGNDDDATDAMMQEVSRHVGMYVGSLAPQAGLDYTAVVNINNYSNVTLGTQTAASADGRHKGDPLANGNAPTAGRDKNGITALLNSMVKPDPSVHAGYVHNMKFSRRMFTADRPKLEALLGAYFASGGTQAMITVVNRGDLEEAIRDPQKHANLIVRIGGFSARFVTLPKDVQQDLLNRTLY